MNFPKNNPNLQRLLFSLQPHYQGPGPQRQKDLPKLKTVNMAYLILESKASFRMQKAKSPAQRVGWVQSHPVPAGLIGAGVACTWKYGSWIGDLLCSQKRGEGETGKKVVNHARSIDIHNSIVAEFPHNAVEKSSVFDEIDWDDEKFLEFLRLLLVLMTFSLILSKLTT